MVVKVRRIIKQEINIPDLGEQIKKARDADNRSVTELAKLVGISRNYWYQLEAETVLGGVAEDTFRKIEEVLNVDFGVRFEEDTVGRQAAQLEMSFVAEKADERTRTEQKN
jgi:transcriptional regulator with XRE-family HTH domain